MLRRILRTICLGWLLLLGTTTQTVSGHGTLIDPKSRNLLAFEGKYQVGKWSPLEPKDVVPDLDKDRFQKFVGGGSPITSFGITALNSQFIGLYSPENLNAPVQKVCGGRNAKGPAEDNPFEKPGPVVTPLVPGQVYAIKFCMAFLHPTGRFNAGLCRASRLQDCLTLSAKEAKRVTPLKLSNANGKSGDSYHYYPPPYDGPAHGGYALFQLEQRNGAWVRENYPTCTIGNLVNGGFEVSLQAQIPDMDCPDCVLAVSWETGSICKFRDSPHEWFREKYDEPHSFSRWTDTSICTNDGLPLQDGKCGVDKPRGWCWEQVHPEIFHNCADVSISGKNGNTSVGPSSAFPTGPSVSAPTADDNVLAVYATTGSVISSVLSTACIASLLVFVVSSRKRRLWRGG